MVMDIPKSLRIGANTYDVILSKGTSSREGLYGNITYGGTTIEIEDSLSQSKTLDVLIHEVVHALLYESGNEDHTEEEVNMVGKVLTNMLRDNDFSFMRKVVK